MTSHMFQGKARRRIISNDLKHFVFRSLAMIMFWDGDESAVKIHIIPVVSNSSHHIPGVRIFKHIMIETEEKRPK